MHAGGLNSVCVEEDDGRKCLGVDLAAMGNHAIIGWVGGEEEEEESTPS